MPLAGEAAKVAAGEDEGPLASQRTGGRRRRPPLRPHRFPRPRIHARPSSPPLTPDQFLRALCVDQPSCDSTRCGLAATAAVLLSVLLPPDPRHAGKGGSHFAAGCGGRVAVGGGDVFSPSISTLISLILVLDVGMLLLMTIIFLVSDRWTWSRPCSLLHHRWLQFSDNFAIMLFHYDGRVSEWNKFEWSKRAIHINVSKQTKWWYAKRFLHRHIVAAYEYIFIWDEDLGVDHINAEEFIKLVKKYGLDICEPGLEPED